MWQKLMLNGSWDIEPGDEKPDKFFHQITVPSLVDCAEPPFEWENFNYFWYHKPFNLSALNEHARVFLHLEQVQFGTQVHVNHMNVGGDIPCYTSQVFDLTPGIRKGENHLHIRVGRKENLPPESAVGNDFEKPSFIPGIWGDAYIEIAGPVTIEWIRIIPNIHTGTIQLRVDLKNWAYQHINATLSISIKEKKSGKQIQTIQIDVRIEKALLTKELTINMGEFELWAPENPFLYQVETDIWIGENRSHKMVKAFGMREFQIKGRHFYLNGKRVVLKGSNIAFHRLLSDPHRNRLPWDETWIRKVLVDIPRKYNLAFFRIHNGHAYNRWYDIADEYGIILQDEWMFWHTTGTKEQIKKEFTDWVKENAHHPSILIWDPLNESEDPVITEEIVPDLKTLDPTRPWEHVDFIEDHPYIFSLGPVVPEGAFGFSRSVELMQYATEPVMVNEFVWWWLDEKGKPSGLMQDVILRWMGREYTPEQLLNYQAELAAYLCEFFRNMDVDAVMPFVYLSASKGATSHWFLGSLQNLTPKPILPRLATALHPVGIVIETQSRNVFKGERSKCNVHVINDYPHEIPINVRLQFQSEHIQQDIHVWSLTLLPMERKSLVVNVTWPDGNLETVNLVASATDMEGNLLARSERRVRLFSHKVLTAQARQRKPLIVFSRQAEIFKWLNQNGWNYKTTIKTCNSNVNILVDRESIFHLTEFEKKKIEACVKEGALLIIQQPEFNIKGAQEVELFPELSMQIVYRSDPEKGGYDSYIYLENKNHPLFNGLDNAHFRLWNGYPGGDIVSQHHVYLSLPYQTIASCNLGLRVPAIMQLRYGKGAIIITRLILDKRLLNEHENAQTRDPAAIQYWLNLLNLDARYLPGADRGNTTISVVQSSDGQVYDIDGTRILGRWASKGTDKILVKVKFYQKLFLTGIKVLKSQFMPSGITVKARKGNDDEYFPVPAIMQKNSGGQWEILWKPTKIKELLLIYEVSDQHTDHTLWEAEFLVQSKL